MKEVVFYQALLSVSRCYYSCCDLSALKYKSIVLILCLANTHGLYLNHIHKSHLKETLVTFQIENRWFDHKKVSDDITLIIQTSILLRDLALPNAPWPQKQPGQG